MRKITVILLITLLSMQLFLPIEYLQPVSAQPPANYLPVLTYHHLQRAGSFNEDKSGRLIVTPEKFKAQLEYIKAAGYNSITCQELQAFYQNRAALPENPILITFDDGYESNYKLAFPILQELNMKATIFVVTRSIRDEDDPDSGLKTSLSWQQAREMVNSGLVDIQTHTHNLHNKLIVNGYERSAVTTRIIVDGKLESDRQYRERITKDFSWSKSLIEGWLGSRVSAISYPYGEYNAISQQAARELGMNLQFTTTEGVSNFAARPPVFERITVSQKYSGEDIIDLIKKYTRIILTDLKNHWAEKAINKSLELKIVTGYQDRTFRPDRMVTRVEFLAMLNAVKPFEKQAKAVEFKDIQPGEWYYSLVQDAYGAQVVRGYGDNLFKPNKEITREEAAVLIKNHLFGKKEEASPIEGQSPQFADFEQISDYARESVELLSKVGLVRGTNRGGYLLFAPLKGLTRAEACVILKNYTEVGSTLP